MKRYLIAFVTLAAAIATDASAAAGREVYSMNEGWKFFTGAATGSDGAAEVSLPHTWGAEAMTGNYLRELDVPAAWAGRRVFLDIGGANSVAWVFVNGRLAGEHRGGYAAFCREITGLLRVGEKNHIRIVVSNAPRYDVLPTAGDMNSYGGLVRGVELVVTGPATIAPHDGGVRIVPKTVSRDKVEAEAVVDVLGAGANGHVDIAVISPDGVTVATGDARAKGDLAVTVPIAIYDPQLWDGVRDPALYRVVATLRDGRQVIDNVEVATGFRTVGADPARGFMLNGESYPLRGVVVTQDRPLVGTAISRAQVEEDVELIKNMGANAVRVLGIAHHPAFYELCDRAGIVVWSDFPLVGEAFLTDKAYLPTDDYRRNARGQAEEIMRQQFNHPCVAMWGVFGNLRTGSDDPTTLVRELDTMAKADDPSRLTAASSNADGDINFVTDLICWSHHFGWTEGLPTDINMWKTQLLKEWSTLRSAVSYGAGGSTDHQEPAASRPPWLGPRHPERWQTYLHETYWNSLRADSMFWGVWVSNMFDYGAARREWGGRRGVNDLGLVTFDRKVTKDAYWFYKANWYTGEPFVYIAERRWTSRPDAKQTIKVYSNASTVELFVNGASCGVKEGSGGVFTWDEVTLRRGSNTVEAAAPDAAPDAVKIEIGSGRRL